MSPRRRSQTSSKIAKHLLTVIFSFNFFLNLSEKDDSTDSSSHKSMRYKKQQIVVQQFEKKLNDVNLQQLQVVKRPIAETNPKQFADIISKKLENLTVNNSRICSKESSDIEAERMIDEHINRVFKSSNEQTPLVIEPMLATSVNIQQQYLYNKANLSLFNDSKNVPTFSSTSTSDRQSVSFKNYDSGISVKSVTSIERVSDWLANTSTISRPNTVLSVKTTVAYFLPGEEVAYISTFNGNDLTLAKFKELITKKGNFRYFFKTKTDLLDEECSIVYQEVTDDSINVPMFNDKVIAKIVKSNE
jgi:hypothetical protein